MQVYMVEKESHGNYVHPALLFGYSHDKCPTVSLSVFVSNCTMHGQSLH